MVPFLCILLFSVAAGQSVGDVRLIGGSNTYEGRVEVLYNIHYVSGVPTYSWGTVCDDNWGTNDARVVCRQLGYSPNGAGATYTAFSYAHFGQGSGTIYMDDVYCTGSEARLIDCSYDSDTSDCGHHEDAGVRCITSSDIRLVGGSTDWEGRVEVFISGQWGTVCDDAWSSNEARVVCRQLGYSDTSATAYCCAYFGSGSGPILMDNVDCSGWESTLLRCPHAAIDNCGHHDDAGVVCQPHNCRNGNIRLGGGDAHSGRVEVCLDQRWGTVCDDGWSISDAEVACKRLGYFSLTTGVSHYVSAYYGEGTGPVLMSDIACTGSENTLLDCSYSDMNSCTHSQDAGVDCAVDRTFSEGDIRLVDGSNPWQGRVEIFISGTWGTIVDDYWGREDAQVVCRQLGYQPDGAYTYGQARFGSGNGPIHFDNTQCVGSESRLIDCPYSTDTAGDSHNEDAGVGCRTNSCQDGDVRLVEGETELEGRVQLCLNRAWGTVCDHLWSVADANVVCTHLGYHPTASLNYSTTNIPEDHTGPVFLDNVNCSGSEERLIDCNFDYFANRCTHVQDVAVLCQPAPCMGEVRLVGGDTEREGRLEVCVNQRWGTVCDVGWTLADSQVVCKQLGYSATSPVSGYFSSGVLPILMTDVDCDGSESRLINCSYEDSRSSCSHSRDVGIHCQPASCVDGDIQLVDREEEWKGILEVCFNQRWGTVNGEGWDSTETEVVCRQLGYQQTGTSYYISASGTGPVFMSSVSCSGSESTLLDCSYTVSLSASHSNDISVWCSPVPCADGDIQLVGGETGREGRVEVCLDQRWGTVNGDGWSSADAQVVCRQLGYLTASLSTSSSEGTGPILLDNVGCYGWETRLIDCSHSRDTSEDTHDGDVAVQCLPAVPPAPQNISIETLSSTSLRIQWALIPPLTAEYGTILQYTVSCCAKNITGDKHVETLPRNDTHFDMTALQPYTNYNCCVNAENIAGDGMGVCAEGDTAEDVPSSAPVELVSSPLNSRNLLLSWAPPLQADRNGVIRMYYVNLTEEETGKIFHFETEFTSLSQTSLHPFYHYSWVVGAYTVGLGPYSSSLTVQMPEDIPSGSPSILTALRTGPTSMEIAYTQVSMQERNGVITAYCVTYYLNNKNTGCQSPVTTSAPATGTTAVIEGLDPTREYCVTVAARTRAGVGEPSQVVIVGLFSSVNIEILLLGGPSCTWSLVTQDSAPVIDAVIESILTAVNSGCSYQCSLAPGNIKQSRLVCCDENKDEVAFQAQVYDIDNDEFKNQVQKWVDSQPEISGWNIVLNVSKSWQFDLSDDAFLESEAKCDQVESSGSNLSDNSSSDSLEITIPTIVLSAVLGSILIVLILAAILGITIRWHRKKPSETTYDSMELHSKTRID